MARRLTQRGKDRKAQLMAYAVARFAANGYHPTSVADIVSGLGVGKGVFYWYFESKEELLREILRDAQTELRRHQQQVMADEPDPIHRVELGIRASLRWSAEHRDHQALVRFAATEERFRPALRKGEEIAIADIVKHLEDGIAQGRIRDGDPTVLAHAMLGVMAQLTRAFVHDRSDDPDRIADLAIAFVREGLLGEASPASQPRPARSA
jgi:AcrR family transcriptional regulator